jgi:altronate hydrolase
MVEGKCGMEMDSDGTPVEDGIIHLSPADNVAVARRDLSCGARLGTPRGVICIAEPIRVGHKVSLELIPPGSPVFKYGQIIGRARAPIAAGAWVHTHNLAPDYHPDQIECATDEPIPPDFPDGLPRTFMGYRRPGGRVGTRNHVAILAASNCASHVCERIAAEFTRERPENFDGVAALPHGEGCGQDAGADTRQLERTLKGIVSNPNVAAALIVGLGCEVNGLARYVDSGVSAAIEIQSAGGTLKASELGVRKVREIIEKVRLCRRTSEPVEHLVVGLNCGGSDAFSGISANPALGCACDLLVAAGATVVLAETPEIYGAEHLLARRAVDIATGQRLIGIVRRYEEYAARRGATMNSNPAPGNRDGGISNVVEKSLGAVMKGGTTRLTGVVEYGERIVRSGLVMMDTPGYDPVSITGLGAGGCNLMAFTTGRGTGIGFPVVPLLKIATNSRIFSLMNDNMDVNAGDIVDGTCGIRDKGVEIFHALIRTASGELTRSERLGHREFAPWRIGPVM